MYLIQKFDSLASEAPKPIVLNETMFNEFTEIANKLAKEIRFDYTIYDINNAGGGFGSDSNLYYDHNRYKCYTSGKLSIEELEKIEKENFNEFCNLFKTDIAECYAFYPYFKIRYDNKITYIPIVKFATDLNLPINTDSVICKALVTMAKFMVEAHNSLLK